MARLREIVIDAARPAALASFWAAALEGYAVRAYDEAEIARLASLGFTPQTDPAVMVDGPGPSLCFQQERDARAGRNRVHLDIEAAEPEREIARLTALGARVRDAHPGFTVMLDPEGNPFCVVAPR